jgi:hypothetical protein
MMDCIMKRNIHDRKENEMLIELGKSCDCFHMNNLLPASADLTSVHHV